MEGITTAFETAVKVIQTDAISMITSALPVGLGIMGIGMAVRIGIRFFRSVAS